MYNNWLPPGHINLIAILVYSVVGTILVSVWLWVRTKLVNQGVKEK